MADLRIHNFGDTANGKVSGFIPNAHVGQIGWKNINPAADLLDRLMAEKALELNQAKHALDEQKLAYGAANDEADRDLARELAGQKAKATKDLIKLEYSHKNSLVNKAKAEEDLIQKEINKYYGYLENLGDQGMDISNPYFFTVAREYARDTGNTDIVNFFTNYGAKAAELNNLYRQNHIKEDVTGQIMKKQSGDSKTKKINFINKN